MLFEQPFLGQQKMYKEMLILTRKQTQ